jgi:hypothetical protein
VESHGRHPAAGQTEPGIDFCFNLAVPASDASGVQQGGCGLRDTPQTLREVSQVKGVI